MMLQLEADLLAIRAVLAYASLRARGGKKAYQATLTWHVSMQTDLSGRRTMLIDRWDLTETQHRLRG